MRSSVVTPPSVCPYPARIGIGVVGSYGEGNGRSLIINGHIDVVSPGDESKWRYPPWKGTLAEGRVYGRGSADMKGGIVAALYAIKAIIDSGVRLKGKVMLETVIGEEDGGVGALDAVLRGYRADAAIVPEPSELSAVPAHAGVMAFRVTIQGKSSPRKPAYRRYQRYRQVPPPLRGSEEARNGEKCSNQETRSTLVTTYRPPLASER